MKLLVLVPHVLLLKIFVTTADGGHVLALPGEYSHWLNMRTIIEKLVRRNHTVTVLVPDASPSVSYNNSRDAVKFNFLVFKVPFTRSEFKDVMQDFIHFSMYEAHNSSLLHRILMTHNAMRRFFKLGMQQCDSMVKNQQLMATLRDSAFDVVLLDPMVMCGDLVADVLGVPLILSLTFSLGSALERHCGQAPAPASFVPASPLPYGDHMTIVERLINSITYMVTSALSEVYWRLTFSSYYSEVKGSPGSFCSSMERADIWLIRTFWDLETPRPVPPNFKFVGGLQCKPANQLPEDLEAFMQSSSNAGVVVVSFGSMVPSLTAERADVIATALGQIPQKVIWLYSGNTPSKLSSNTKLYDWIPQNDLLGHPLTRAVVMHGGNNGLYEAVFHGVPVVGVPLFSDQSDNLARLSRRGAAIILHFNHMTAKELMEALHTIVNEPSYKLNMQHLSVLQRDQLVAPLNTAAFWVEFVMRHGGAKHLLLASRNLNWFQYYSLDTSIALLLAVATCAATCWAGLCCCLQRCRRQTVRENSD